MNPPKINTSLLSWLILLCLSLIWGSSFILMKKGLEAFSFQQVAALRMFIAFLFIAPFTITKIFKIPRKYWIYMALAAIMGNGIPAFLFTKAETYLSSSLAGILNALTPLFTFILGVLFFQSRSRWYRFAGVVLGLAGAIGLVLVSEGSNFKNFSYGLYVVMATILYALSTNIVKRYLQEVNPLHMTGFYFFVTGIPLGIYLFTTGFVDVMRTHEAALPALGYVALLAIFGSALSIVLWNLLIQKTNAIFAASVTYIMPVVAIIWGVLDGEQFLPVYLLMMLLILVGVYLTNRK